MAALVVPRHRLAQLRQAVGLRVAMVGRVIGGALQRLQHVWRRRQVWVANAKGDDVHALGALGCRLLADLGKQIGWQLLDTTGELHGDVLQSVW